jgi:UDP-GlcNAc3NAcA epimerase
MASNECCAFADDEQRYRSRSVIDVVTVVGARPQFIKAWPVSQALRDRGIRHHLIHTGQHYDENMSRIFFKEMGIAEPDMHLNIGSGRHGAQTGAMLAALEEAFVARKPDWVIVYGDTNSTLAGALAASKLHIKIAHVEAGLRSFNRRMPEELNRVVTDHLSTALFCPSDVARGHLAREGIVNGVHVIGDVMFDAVAHFVGDMADSRDSLLNTLRLESRAYFLATIHRAENTDDEARLRAIESAFESLPMPVLFPVHPRTRGRLSPRLGSNVRVIEPVGYIDSLLLQRHAAAVLTDSGGIQKEAYWLGVPCVTLRDETEWTETVAEGWNVVVGADRDAIISAVMNVRRPNTPRVAYGHAGASMRIAQILGDWSGA